jgi:hypothetical protein
MVHVQYRSCHGWLKSLSQHLRLGRFITVAKILLVVTSEFRLYQLKQVGMMLITLGAVLFVIVLVFYSSLLRRYQYCNKWYIFLYYRSYRHPITDYKIHSHRPYYIATLLSTDHSLHINYIVTCFRVSFFVPELLGSSWRL